MRESSASREVDQDQLPLIPDPGAFPFEIAQDARTKWALSLLAFSTPATTGLGISFVLLGGGKGGVADWLMVLGIAAVSAMAIVEVRRRAKTSRSAPE